jgi:hypothetical protein
MSAEDGLCDVENSGRRPKHDGPYVPPHGSVLDHPLTGIGIDEGRRGRPYLRGHGAGMSRLRDGLDIWMTR